MAQESVTNLIRAEAQKQGVNPDLAVKIANVESGLDPSAKNPKSSASGLFQIIDRTRKELGGDPKKRMDPLENVRLGVKLIKQNEGQLMSSLGRRPTDHELYMAHMFGPTGAVNLIQADPSMPVSKAVLQFSSPKTAEAIVKNNRLTGTVGDVIGQFQQKFGVKPAVQQKTAPVNKKPAPTEGPVPFQTGFDLVAQAPSYQAALAMASLASLEDEDTEKEDKTPVAEEVQPPSAAQMLAGLQMPSLQAFATGGAVSQQPRRRAAPGTLDDAASFYATMQTPVLSAADRAELERRAGGASGFGAYEGQIAAYRERLGELAPIVDEYNRRVEAFQGTFARDAAGNVITSTTARPGYTLYEGGVYAQRSVDPRASITGFERPVAGAGRLSPFERYSTYCDSGGCYEVVAATGFDYVNPQGERINIRTDVDPFNLFRARRTVTNYAGEDFSYNPTTNSLSLYEKAPVRPRDIPDSPTPTGLVGTKAELEALYAASQERAAQGAAQRSTALQAVSQRNPYNLAGFSTDFSNINRPSGALFADGGPVNKDELVAPPVVVTPEEKPKTESKRMLDKLLEARKEATSTIPGMAADIGASIVNPVYGTAASAADFETARREGDLLGMGLAGIGLVPGIGPALKGLGMKAAPAVLGAMRPKGGVFVTSGKYGEMVGPGKRADTLSKFDKDMSNILDMVETKSKVLISGISPESADAIRELFDKKARKYFTTQFASTDDPIYDALKEGRIKPVGAEDKKLFRRYMVTMAREGDPEALQDLAFAYDKALQRSVFAPKGQPLYSPETFNLVQGRKQEALAQAEAQRLAGKEKLVPEELGSMETYIERYDPSAVIGTKKALFEEGANVPPHIQRAIQEGELVYDISDFDVPKFMKPSEEMIDELAKIDPAMLRKMSYPEAVAAINKQMRLSADWADVVSLADKKGAKAVPKESRAMFTQTAIPLDEGQKWVRLTDSKAAALEGKMMKHSVGGYDKKGTYGMGGKDAFDAGKAEVFSMRGPDDIPLLTIEVDKVTSPSNGIVTQVKGISNQRLEELLPYTDQIVSFFEKTGYVPGTRDLPDEILQLVKKPVGKAKGGMVDKPLYP